MLLEEAGLAASLRAVHGSTEDQQQLLEGELYKHLQHKKHL
jgi:hypothetical protein